MYSLVLGLAIVVAAPGPKEPPKKDAPTVVGSWAAESVVIGGNVEKLEPGMVFTLTGDGKCLVKEGKDDKPEEMSYFIDPKKDPGHFDLRESGMQGEYLKGIYKLDGDTLIVCLTMKGDRPSAFASPAGSETILVTLKRMKKD